MSRFYGRGRSSELLPRYVFIEPLLEGRRVLELGVVDVASGAPAAHLVERGAKSVLSLGRDEAAVVAARKEYGGAGLVFRAGIVDELADGAFDLVLVHDVSMVLGDTAASRLSRLLAPGGFLLATLPNPAGPALPGLAGDDAPDVPSYAEVVTALSAAFPSIEVATQQALVGYAVAPVTGEEPDLAIDGTLAGQPEAAYWLFLCGEAASGLTEQALVPLPTAPRRAEAAAAGGSELRARLASLEEQLASERGRVEELRKAGERTREELAERESWI